MSNHITIELCAEDRTRLDDIIALLKQSLSIESPSRALSQEHSYKPNEGGLKPNPPKPPKPTEPEKPTVTLADVQALVQKLATPTSGKRDAVKSIVNTYAKRVSDIPADKLDEVMTKLTELEGA